MTLKNNNTTGKKIVLYSGFVDIFVQIVKRNRKTSRSIYPACEIVNYYSQLPFINFLNEIATYKENY